MRLALVHDQLHEFGGAERVFFALKEIFPDAPIYTAFVNRDRLYEQEPKAKNWEIHESFAAHIPFISRLYSPLRFLAPAIWESFDFSRYDVVISSSGWYMCKGIRSIPLRQGLRLSSAEGPQRRSGQVGPIHISYMHHPPRYLYGYETAMEWQRYLPIKIYAYIVNHFLRLWDYESSQRVDLFIANSEETKRRIEKFYRRNSTVIYPPVTLSSEEKIRNPKFESRNYYITLSRLQKAKHIELLIQAANEEKFPLKIVGEGKDREYLESIAGPTVEFLGRVPDKHFVDLYAGAKAFLFASRDEEFGIAPIEAMGYGVPVIAYRSGGLIETVKDGKNGFLFDELTVDSLVAAINTFNKLSQKEYEQMCKIARNEAERYSEDRFEKEIKDFIRTRATF